MAMKFHLIAVPVSALLLCAQGSAVADTATKASHVSASASAAVSDRQEERAWERTHRASKIIGMDVRNRQGQKVGDIKDVVLDDHGEIAYAVVSTGGFLGVGDRLHAVPWAALQKNGEEKYFVLDTDKERLKKAPGFDSKHWPNMADERWNSENRTFYSTPNR